MTCGKKTFPAGGKVSKGKRPSRAELGRLYSLFAREEFIEPDPLSFLRKCRKKEDREVVALIASALAFGRVELILKAIEEVLTRLSRLPGKGEAETLKKNSPESLEKAFSSFKYRFVSGQALALFLAGAGALLREYSSLEDAFLAGYDADRHTDLLPALENFGNGLCRFFPEGKSFLFPVPSGKSACKRPLLMLRWLVRDRDVDTGTWKKIPKNLLLVPLDTHMFRTAKALGLCSGKTPTLAAAKEITQAFARIDPEDPVKFDFPLTRFGINPAFKGKSLFSCSCRKGDNV